MSIASALFSDSQSRVLRWLFGQPEREFHLSELRRLTEENLLRVNFDFLKRPTKEFPP